MALRCWLAPLLRAYASEGGSASTAAAAAAAAEAPQQRRQSVELTSTGEIDELRKELAAAQFRVAELQLSQLAVHEALLRRMDDTDKAAHKAATELRYTALALQCHYDLLETELRRVLAAKPSGVPMTDEDAERLRCVAIEAGSREMVRKNIGFRVQKVSEEPAAVSKVNCKDSRVGDNDNGSCSGSVVKNSA